MTAAPGWIAKEAICMCSGSGGRVAEAGCSSCCTNTFRVQRGLIKFGALSAKSTRSYSKRLANYVAKRVHDELIITQRAIWCLLTLADGRVARRTLLQNKVILQIQIFKIYLQKCLILF